MGRARQWGGLGRVWEEGKGREREVPLGSASQRATLFKGRGVVCVEGLQAKRVYGKGLHRATQGAPGEIGAKRICRSCWAQPDGRPCSCGLRRVLEWPHGDAGVKPRSLQPGSALHALPLAAALQRRRSVRMG